MMQSRCRPPAPTEFFPSVSGQLLVCFLSKKHKIELEKSQNADKCSNFIYLRNMFTANSPCSCLEQKAALGFFDFFDFGNRVGISHSIYACRLFFGKPGNMLQKLADGRAAGCLTPLQKQKCVATICFGVCISWTLSR